MLNMKQHVFLHCSHEPTCVVFFFNHKASNKLDINCQLSNATENAIHGTKESRLGMKDGCITVTFK